MIGLPGFAIVELLRRGSDHVTYRATREVDGCPVVVKMPVSPLPSARLLARLQHEFEVTHGRALEGVVHALSLERLGSTAALVLEDHGAVSLAMRGDAPMELDQFFEVALGLVEGVRSVHDAGFIHKDIKPANIVSSPDFRRVWLVDFGMATEFSQSTLDTAPTHIEGTLAYMAPEQTGRMNRPVDGRSDLYSVGVTLFQLLTGSLPFASTDPLELVHHHVARVPPSPRTLRSDAPAPVCRLILRLLRKDAETRYQTAHGLLYDLELCRDAHRRGEQDVELGTRDVADEFRIPRELYGREREIGELEEAVDRVVRGGVELLQVTGPSGIGKSVLVGELVRLSTTAEATHARGKFDQFARDVPYLAVRDAFRDLGRRLLAEPAARLEAWRASLLEAVGDYGALLTELVPELGLVLGPQPDVPPLALAESQARFNLVVRRFVRALASQERPLVLFLDDMQWADGASLTLLHNLLTDVDLSHVLLVVAYRDGEVGPAHPYRLMLERLGGAARANEEPIAPTPLGLDAVTWLVAETLDTAPAAVRELAAAVTDKTGGNPFFVNEFLRELHRKGLVRFDAGTVAWTWDLQGIARQRITDNVVDLVVGRLGELEEEARRALRLAAVVGHRFTLAALARVWERSPEEAAESLRSAIAANVIAPLGDDFKYRALQQDRAAEIVYVFAHDRVHQAAYSTIPEAERPALHRRVGELLLADGEEAVEEGLFAIVNHLDEALALWESPEERLEVAELNLRACRKANVSMAYQAARRYSGHGVELLGEEGWVLAPEVMRGLHFEALKTAFLLGLYDDIEPLHQALVVHSRSVHDRALATEIKVQQLISTMQYEAALDVGIPLLHDLGVPLPRKAHKLQVVRGLVSTMWLLRGREVESLIELPEMSDETLRVGMRILVTLSAAAYASEPDLFPQMVFSIVQASVRHGNAPESAFGYVCYGLALCSVLGRYDEGHGFGNLALGMVENQRAHEYEAKVRFLFGLFIQPWTEPLVDTLDHFQIGAARGLETGDLEYYSYNFWGVSSHELLLGRDLVRLADSARAQHESILDQSQEKVSLLLLLVRDVVSFLRGEGPIRSGDIDEARVLELSRERGDKTSVGYCHTFRCMRRYLVRDYPGVLAAADQCRVVQEGIDGQIFVPLFQFYESLAQLALARETGSRPRRVGGHQRRLRKVADRVPGTFLAKWHLVEGERHAVSGNRMAALTHFEQAIEQARGQENRHDMALGHRLAAACFEASGMGASAVFHRVEEERAWRSWGANRFAEGGARQLTDSQSLPSLHSTYTSESNSLDVSSVVRAAQAIAQQLRPSDVVSDILSVSLSSAGATSGAIVLRGPDGRFYVHATAAIDEAVVLESPPIALSQARLPGNVVRLALRTGEAVVIDDVATDERIADERAILADSAVSLLCAPMRLQGEVRGAIVLLNQLVRGAFTPSRIQFLEVMAAQAAISLQNSMLFRDLEETLEVQTALAKAHARFVPHQFLAALGRERIQDVELGDSASKELSVLFSDIRGFTPLIKSLGPESSIRFINQYLSHMEPPILAHGGFVDSYIGDAVMALFDDPVDGAVGAGVDMLRSLEQFNRSREREGEAPVRIGVGINTGPLMLGTIGGPRRLKCGVIGDTVNLAARIESLTKQLGVSLLIGEDTYGRMVDPSAFRIRPVERVRVVGRNEPVTLYEVFDGDDKALRDAKSESLPTYERGLEAYYQRAFAEAEACFASCLQAAPGDVRAEAFGRRAKSLAAEPPDAQWDGVLTMTRK